MHFLKKKKKKKKPKHLRCIEYNLLKKKSVYCIHYYYITKKKNYCIEKHLIHIRKKIQQVHFNSFSFFTYIPRLFQILKLKDMSIPKKSSIFFIHKVAFKLKL